MPTQLTRRSFLSLSALAGSAVALAACSSEENSEIAEDEITTTGEQAESTPVDTSALAFDNAAWNLDADAGIWWQIGVAYCASPQATDYESLGIYVPQAYLDGTQNDDGTYTCTPASGATVGSYTTETAPFVMPVNTAGYSAQAAPTSYSAQGISDYTSAGLIYVYAGCRGRNSQEGDSFPAGAPWGVTDLKAAVRYLRLNASVLPGDTSQVFTFGHSGGGAQSSLMGATGDSELYLPYLETIGAATEDAGGAPISDAIAGAMCWCPITALDQANEAYEWMMGQYASSGTRAEGTFTELLSKDLAAAYATFVNGADLSDENGVALRLDESEEGVYAAGTYYDYLLGVIEGSLNDFLGDTEFPYAPSSSFSADGGFAGGGAPSGDGPSGAPSGDGGPSDDGMPGGNSGDSEGSDSSTTYETAADYVAALNGDNPWISYDEATNTATVTSVGAFVLACKSPSKDVCAFDALDRSQAENYVFGTGDSPALHFDPTIAELLSVNEATYAAASDWDVSYPSDWASDLETVDSLGTSIAMRQNMYNPMYYVCSGYEGFGSSTPASHWRIRTGIEQGDTSVTTEMNLALALAACEGVTDVDFATVWGQGHTTAERTGSSTANFLAWVEDCVLAG